MITISSAPAPARTSAHFRTGTRPLPHRVPNAGPRLAAAGQIAAHPGDSGPGPQTAELARRAGLPLAEASYADQVPGDSRPCLSSARRAGRRPPQAGAGHLLLTHMLPGADHRAARAAARSGYDGDISVAIAGLALDLHQTRPRDRSASPRRPLAGRQNSR